MQEAIKRFRQNISYVDDLGNIHRYLSTTTTSATQLALDEILRAEWVMCISCLDAYIHDLLRLGIIAIHCGQRVKPKKFNSDVKISMQGVSLFIDEISSLVSLSPDLGILNLNFQKLITDVAQQQWLENEVTQLYSRSTFQGAQQIELAIQVISDIKIWQELSKLLNIPAEDIKKQLNLIVNRRNKIAHEADTDQAILITTGVISRYQISHSDIDTTLQFLKDFAEAFYQILK